MRTNLSHLTEFEFGQKGIEKIDLFFTLTGKVTHVGAAAAVCFDTVGTSGIKITIDAFVVCVFMSYMQNADRTCTENQQSYN